MAVNQQRGWSKWVIALVITNVLTAAALFSVLRSNYSTDGNKIVIEVERRQARKLQANLQKEKVCPVFTDPCQATDSADVPDHCMNDTPGLFEELSEAEVTSVNVYLNKTSVKEELNWTSVILVELAPPVKAEALQFWEADGPRPLRTAMGSLVVSRGGVAKRIMIKVYPVPHPTSHEQIPVVGKVLEANWKDPMPLIQGVWEQGETMLRDMSLNLSMQLQPVLHHIYNGSQLLGHGCTKRCIFPSSQWPGWTVPTAEGGWKAYVVWGHNRTMDGVINFDGWWLHRLYLLQYVFELTEMKLAGIWFLGNKYPDAQAVLDAWNDPANIKWRDIVVPMPESNEEALYSTFLPRPGPTRGDPSKPLGPLCYDPYGHRFSIQRQRVEWMGWSLEGGLAKRGPRWWDVRFKGERIAYEISLQESMAGYGGADPAIYQIMYFDSSEFGIGRQATQLVHGVDCPLNAAYADMPMDGVLRRRALCVFEFDTSLPVLGHNPLENWGAGSVRGTALCLRMRTTVGNYDYYHDTYLYLDGSLQVAVRLTGYMTGASYIPGLSEEYAAPVWHYASGSLHDHTLHWKVDLDVAGVSNSLKVTEVKALTLDPEPFSGSRWDIKKLHHSFPATEDDSTFNFNPATPKQVYFVNKNATNAWGAMRGYMLEYTMLHSNVLPHDSPQLKAFAWTKYMLAVTARKESEWTSSMEPDFAFPWDPILDFDSFLDGDSVQDTDLVAWVTSGLYHIVRSEDAPVTPISAGHAPGFILKPSNYFDENPAMDAPDLFTITGAPSLRSRVPLIQKYAAGHRCVPQMEPLPIDPVDNVDYEPW